MRLSNLVFLLLILLLPNELRAQVPTLYLDVNEVQVGPGQQFDLTITAANISATTDAVVESDSFRVYISPAFTADYITFDSVINDILPPTNRAIIANIDELGEPVSSGTAINTNLLVFNFVNSGTAIVPKGGVPVTLAKLRFATKGTPSLNFMNKLHMLTFNLDPQYTSVSSSSQTYSLSAGTGFVATPEPGVASLCMGLLALAMRRGARTKVVQS